MKNAIIVILILICCWLGFMVYQNQNKDNSVFEKQKECSSLYQSVKDYIIEDHWFNIPNVWKSEVWSVRTRYNKELDTCLAETHEYVTLNWSGWYKNFTVYSLYDIYNWYEVIDDCASIDNCEKDFRSVVNKYK